ncbi:EcsC family protein [Paraflavisolibacter sp. H34]|uniref:EcsC family protein n=1 Tax=Huijunlia imazamoxiresistens TaxID=3127457 RepID=UPI003018A009
MLYEQFIQKELKEWQRKMQAPPSTLDRWSKRMQDKMNSFLPEKVHKALTTTIKQMVRGVLFGATHTSGRQSTFGSFIDCEMAVQRRIDFYKKAAATEGGLTGAGGFLLGLVDFPVLLSMKLKLLFDIAGLYGYDVTDYRERLYLLYIFQLAFSSQDHRRQVYEQIIDWDAKKEALPADIHQFDWRHFQQEYRDYIDLAKMAQLVPGIGAVVGVVVNYRLVGKLGETAMNAFRMRKV